MSAHRPSPDGGRACGVASAARAAAVGIISLVVLGCLDRPIAPLEPRRTSIVNERLTQGGVDKIDLLLAIDNSASMADKQAILALAVPDLVRGLLSPRCVDDEGKPASTQPDSLAAPCPAGTDREFAPVLDVHVGIISSSLGGHGGTFCPDISQDPPSPKVDPGEKCDEKPQGTNNDKGHLLSRVDPFSDGHVRTYEDRGYLAWDPAQKLTPPGEAAIGDAHRGLTGSLTEMVNGVGQLGCGYEAQLESWYRFLVDPAPYKTISVEGGKILRQGVDDVLLAQRREFLRPDSLLAIVMLTDENDCSIAEHGIGYRASTSEALPRARHECAKDPNDRCCRSCYFEGQDDCPRDPSCFTPDGKLAYLDNDLGKPGANVDDPTNLRCFDQKRRFGIDFLYPVERYIHALTEPMIDPTQDSLVVTDPKRAVPNPIFADPDPGDGIDAHRDPKRVFFAGIVGVPWQDIARDPRDLTRGLKSAEELSRPDAAGHSGWDTILGDPARGVPPLDPLMRESIDARSGTQPMTGEPVAFGAKNSINGGERTISPRRDLQYACIFPLTKPRDCNDVCDGDASCNCGAGHADDPLCDAATPTLQKNAKAYPGVRQIEVLKGLGSQGIVGSVCPAQLTEPGTDADRRADYGYRPAIGAIVERLKESLSSQCLPRTLTPDKGKQVSCVIIEARHVDGECTCGPAEGRVPPVHPDHDGALELPRSEAAASGRSCLCEVPQLDGKALEACQNEKGSHLVVDGAPVDGWCYVDATTVPPTGNPALISPSCSSVERRMIRFVGKGRAPSGAVQYITCAGE